MEISKNLAEFAGILLGDGAIYIKEVNGQNRIKISFNSKEKQYIYHVKNLIENLFGVSPILKFRCGENTADLFVFKKSIIMQLLDIGLKLSPKRDNATIPNIF